MGKRQFVIEYVLASVRSGKYQVYTREQIVDEALKAWEVIMSSVGG